MSCYDFGEGGFARNLVREIDFPLAKITIEKVISIREFPELICGLLSFAKALANRWVVLMDIFSQLVVLLAVLLLPREDEK